MINKIKRFYITSSIILQSTLILIIGINFILFLIFLIRDTYRENPVVEKYNKIEINESYPEKNTTVINQLLHETWSRGFKYEAYTQFSEKTFEGKFVNVSDAGIRSNGTHQVWPPDKIILIFLYLGGLQLLAMG